LRQSDHYIFSSAGDYISETGLVHIELMS